MYIIIDCPRCKRYYIKKYGVKTASCPYCGARVRVKPEKFIVYRSLEETRRKLAEMRVK